MGHRSTNYKKWFTSSEPYPIKFKSGYEPYVLVNRRLMPWYDERFRGYGWDKVRTPPTAGCLSFATCHQRCMCAVSGHVPACMQHPAYNVTAACLRELAGRQHLGYAVCYARER